MMIRKVAQSLCMLSPLLLAACAGADGSYTLASLNENIRITGAGQTTEVSAHEQGKYYFRAEQFGLAVKYFEEAVSENPQAVDSLNGLAASYDRLGRHDLSERYYRRALANDPKNPQTLNNLGYSYLLQNRVDLAVAYLRDAQRLDADSQIVLANRKIAEEAFAQQDIAESEERLAALPLEPVVSAPLGELAGEHKAADVQPLDEPMEFAASPAIQQPWIERSSAQVQTLVTQPQVASAGIIQSGGMDPDIVAVTSVVERPLEDLPEPIRANVSVATSAVVPLEPMTPVTVGIAEQDGGLSPLSDESISVAVLESQDKVETTVLVDLGEQDPVTTQLSEVNSSETRGEINTISAAESAVPVEAFAFAEPVVQVALAFEPVRENEVERVELAALPNEGLSVALPENGQDTLVRAERIEVSNGAGRLNMAARMRKFLKDQGISVYRLTNADRFNHMVTTIFYRDGWYDEARRLADLLPAEVRVEKVADQNSDLRLELGGDLLDFDRDLYFSEKRFASGTAG
jgi:Tfp pilus assembly protein PilF